MGLVGCARQPPAAPAARAPQRLVSLAPSLTETLFALGLGARLVGVDDYSHLPAGTQLPRMGGLFNPNFERIVELHPDLALLLPSERDVAEKLGRVGIASLVVPNETLDDVEHAYILLGDRCGTAAWGRELAGRFHRELAPRPQPPRPLQVVLSLGREPGRSTGLYVAGPGTFYDQLLTRLGDRNAFADAPTRYPQVALEEVLARAPDVIVELRESVSPALASELKDHWWGVARLQAASHARVAILSGDHVVTPGPRLPQVYRELAAALDGLREEAPEKAREQAREKTREPR